MPQSHSVWRTADEAARLACGPDTLQNAVVLLTGPTSGIGQATVFSLLRTCPGLSKIILGGRNASLQGAMVAQLDDNDKHRVDASHTLDLNDLSSVQAFAQYILATYPSIDVLICNAGIMNLPKFSTTKQNVEQQFGVNVLGHFLLCQKLLDRTKRQVWVSSYGHTLYGGQRFNIEQLQNYHTNSSKDTTYHGWIAYQQSKLGNILLAKEFAKRHSQNNNKLVAVSLHPGTIYTPLYKETSIVSGLKMILTKVPAVLKGDLLQVIPKTVSAGAATTVFCCCEAELENGGYYSNLVRGCENEAACNSQDASDLYEYCLELCADYL